MNRIAVIIHLLFLPLLCSANHSAHDEKACETIILENQKLISKLITSLGKRHSSHRSVTEFRINQIMQSIQPEITLLMQSKKSNKENLIKILNQQLKQSKQMIAYFDNIFTKMEFAVTSPENDPTPLLTMVQTENKNDAFLIIENKTLAALESLGAPNIKKEKADFVNKMIERADIIIGYLEYSRQELNDFISTMPTKEQESQGKYDIKKLLQKRLDLTANSFSTVIDILDSNGVDTPKYKEVLIYASGEATPDLFNIDVTRSLIKRWMTNVKLFFLKNTAEILTKLCVFILIMTVTLAVSNVIKKLLKKAINHASVQTSKLMRDFITNATGKFVILLGFLVALSQLGVNLGPLLAGLGIISLVIGFALKETLSNIASGILILIYKPYDVGDIIKALDITGIVSHMSLVSTTINSYDNERFIIPNTKIWEDKIDNLTAEKERRVDMIFSIHYKADILKAEEVLADIIDRQPNVLKHPEAQIKIHKLNSSSVDIATRPWVHPSDYWEVYWDITRTVKLRFDEEGITIPYPQVDVHLHSDVDP